MASQNQFIKRYKNFYGFDLKSSDLNFPEQYATEISNIDINPVGSLIKRKGTAAHAKDAGALGAFVYNRIDDNGNEVQELVSVGSTLKKWKSTTIIINYVGAEPSASISILYDTVTSQYRCVLTAGATTALDQALGVGVNEVAPYTCNQLKNAIDALADWTASISGNTSVPAAFIENVSNLTLTTNLTVNAGYWEAVNSTVASPFSGAIAAIDSVDLEPASAVQLQNVLYIATGKDEVCKYDGQSVYRAGVPTPASITTAASVGAGAITGNNYVHRARYIQVDDVGNTCEGNLKTADPALSVAAKDINVTIANVQAGSGFNTNCAIINGAGQNNVTTIVVDNGSGGTHTMKVGDTAYFYDAVSASYVERNVTTVTPTSITIAGAAVTVADNAVISANLRIAIYRNETSGTYPTIWYEVAQIPNNSFAATQLYVDSKTDANLGVELIVPLVDRSPPPKARYLTAFQNLLIAGCLDGLPNVVAWSDIDNAEYFPTPDNQQVIQNLEGDRITAVSPSNDVLIVFQRGAIHSISGDLVEANFRVDQITNDIGCIAHQSVRDIRGSIFFLSEIGPRLMTGASIPSALGSFEDNKLISRIDPFFQQDPTTPVAQVNRLARAWGFHDRKAQKYLLFIPRESIAGGTFVRYCNANSTILVYDYSRDAWLKWDGINAGAGIVVFENDILYLERSIDQLNARRTITWRKQTTGTAYDYNDHEDAIEIVYKSPWDFLGEASLLKNYLALRVFTTDIVPNSFELSCETELNFIPNSPVSLFTLNVGADGYGVTPYGSFYGDPQDSSIKHKLSNGRAKSLRMVFRNDEPQTDIVITGYEIEVVTPYKPAMKA